MFCYSCCSAVKSYGSVWGGAGLGGVGRDSSGLHADPVHPIDVLLGLNPANCQAKVMSDGCEAAETPNTRNM